MSNFSLSTILSNMRTIELLQARESQDKGCIARARLLSIVNQINKF